MGLIINPFFTVTPAFLPTDIAGLIRWYDADFYTGSFADGAIITTPWDDFSTSAEDATPQAGQEPLFKDTILADGKSSVQFINGFKHFDTTQMTLGNYSVVALMRPTADAIVCSSPAGNYQVREQGAGSASDDRPSLFHNDGIVLNFTGAQDTGVFFVRTWARNSGTGVPVFYYNKVQELEDSGETSTTNMLISTIGLFNGGPGAFHLAELLIYNAVLTQSNIDDLHDLYFALKYPGNF